jgi:hypothetical protein
MTSPTKYRKKPVVIEAMYNDGEIETISAILDWINGGNGATGPATYDLIGKASMSIHIETLEGVMRADVGDFIIKGVNGEFYPCKPDIFAKTYEAT